MANQLSTTVYKDRPVFLIAHLKSMKYVEISKLNSILIDCIEQTPKVGNSIICLLGKLNPEEAGLITRDEGVRRWHKEITKYGQGATIEIKSHRDKTWCVVARPDFFIDRCYRVKKDKIPVDLSGLIKSGIDCEFSDNGETWFVGKLQEIYETKGNIYDAGFGVYKYCRPRANHWRSWQGGECPLPEGVLIDVILRDGASIKKYKAKKLRWDHDPKNLDHADIIAFKIVGLADGYCWPLEV